MRALTLSLLLLAPALVSAQAVVGLKAGLNVSNLYGFDEADLDGAERTPSLGFVGGLSAQVPLTPSVALRPEVLYSQKGLELSDEVDGETLTTTFNVDYVEVPLLLRVGVPVSPFADAGLLLGPAFAFEVNEGVSADLDGEDIDPADLDLDGDLFESVDLGAVLGAEFASGPFGVEARYTFGLLDVNNNEEDDPSAPTLRNGVFSVMGVYRFGN